MFDYWRVKGFTSYHGTVMSKSPSSFSPWCPSRKAILDVIARQSFLGVVWNSCAPLQFSGVKFIKHHFRIMFFSCSPAPQLFATNSMVSHGIFPSSFPLESSTFGGRSVSALVPRPATCAWPQLKDFVAVWVPGCGLGRSMSGGFLLRCYTRKLRNEHGDFTSARWWFTGISPTQIAS